MKKSDQSFAGHKIIRFHEIISLFHYFRSRMLLKMTDCNFNKCLAQKLIKILQYVKKKNIWVGMHKLFPIGKPHL